MDTTTAMEIIGHESPLMCGKRYNSVAESDLITAANTQAEEHLPF